MTGAGLTDENLKDFYEKMDKLKIEVPRKDYRFSSTSNVQPDVWFDASMVWEIKTADLTESPIYTAGTGYNENKRGISLRFPRFIRERPDKKPEEATSSEEIYKMYKNQAMLNAGKEKTNFNEDDFYD